MLERPRPHCPFGLCILTSALCFLFALLLPAVFATIIMFETGQEISC